MLNILTKCPVCTASLIVDPERKRPTVVDAVRGEYQSHISIAGLLDTVKEDRRRRLITWFVFISGMVFGAAVAALVLLTPTP